MTDPDSIYQRERDRLLRRRHDLRALIAGGEATPAAREERDRLLRRRHDLRALIAGGEATPAAREELDEVEAYLEDSAHHPTPRIGLTIEPRGGEGWFAPPYHHHRGFLRIEYKHPSGAILDAFARVGLESEGLERVTVERIGLKGIDPSTTAEQVLAIAKGLDRTARKALAIARATVPPSALTPDGFGAFEGARFLSPPPTGEAKGPLFVEPVPHTERGEIEFEE